jgi:hypothetical protein
MLGEQTDPWQALPLRTEFQQRFPDEAACVAGRLCLPELRQDQGLGAIRERGKSVMTACRVGHVR